MFNMSNNTIFAFLKAIAVWLTKLQSDRLNKSTTMTKYWWIVKNMLNQQCYLFQIIVNKYRKRI